MPDKNIVLSIMSPRGGVNAVVVGSAEEAIEVLRRPDHLGGEPVILTSTITIRAFEAE